MMIISFKNDRDAIISLLSSNSNIINLSGIETTYSSFDCVAILDDYNVLDFRIFDPFRLHYSGYLSASGWSHWQCEYLSNINNFVEGYNPSDEEVNIIEEISNY